MRALPCIIVGVALALCAAPTRARAQTVIRMATPVPEGTLWAREIHRFQQVVEKETNGQVRIKVYFDGIAGDELQVGERIRREQLDGAISGGQLCMRSAPSMRVGRILGLFQGRAELTYVLGRLKPIVDEEFRKSGFVNLGLVGIGPELIFLRKPVRTLAELKATKLWLWSLDNTMGPGLDGLHFNTLRADLGDAGRLYDEGKVDGFISAPTAALAFQWSAQARYVIDLRVGFLTGCMVVARRAWDALSHDDQQAIESAAAKLQVRVQETTRQMDEALLGGLFAKQGLQTLPVSPALQAEFLAAAREAEARVEKPAPAATLERVAAWIAEYRAAHRK